MTWVSLVPESSKDILAQAAVAPGITETGAPAVYPLPPRYQGLYLYRAMKAEAELDRTCAWVVVINATKGDIQLPPKGGVVKTDFLYADHDESHLDTPSWLDSVHDPKGQSYQTPESTSLDRHYIFDNDNGTNVVIPGESNLPAASGDKLETLYGVGAYKWRQFANLYGAAGGMTLALDDPLADKFPIFAVNAPIRGDLGVGLARRDEQPPWDDIRTIYEKTADTGNLSSSPFTMAWDYDLTSDQTTDRYVRLRAFAERYSNVHAGVVTITALFENIAR